MVNYLNLTQVTFGKRFGIRYPDVHPCYILVLTANLPGQNQEVVKPGCGTAPVKRLSKA